MRLRLVSLLLCSAFLSSTAYGKTFYFKKDNKGTFTKSIEYERDAENDWELSFKDPEILNELTGSEAEIYEGPIKRKEPSEAEQLIDGSFMILTALAVIATHDTYEISDDLRLTSIRGLLLFFFLFREDSIYRECNGEEYLVGSTYEPTEDGFKRMKTFDELEELCVPPEEEEVEEETEEEEELDNA